jgi:cyclopropane fatty-acyl-phospholipid synthase-like methyltransferase
VDEAVAPDGSPVAVYLAVPLEPDFTAVLDHLDPDASVLDLGCGVGRLVNLLARPDREVVGVDESPEMLRHVAPAVRTIEARLEGLALPERFDAVVLASHLVNVPGRDQRRAFLAAAADHLAADGTVYLQRHAPASLTYEVGVTTQRLATPRGYLRLRLEVHERRGRHLRATSTMAFDDASWSQTFEAELLDAAELDAELRTVGLALDAILDGTWVTARRADDRARPSRRG